MESNNYPRQAEGLPLYKDHGYDPSRQVQSTVVTVSPDEPPVRDHLVWSIFNMIYMNFCCLGLLALVFSVKSRDQKLIGNKNGAQSYGVTSRSLNISATVLTIVSLIIYIAVTLTVMRTRYLEELHRQQL
ncbi:dispanin subfamily A member 2b-like [Discoglossus pictus]